MLALAKIPYRLSPATLTELRNVVPRLEKARLYRGRGGEMVRGAACRLLECIAKAEHPMTKRAQLRMLDTIDECLKHPSADIQVGSW